MISYCQSRLQKTSLSPVGANIIQLFFQQSIHPSLSYLRLTRTCWSEMDICGAGQWRVVHQVRLPVFATNLRHYCVHD